MMKTRNLEASRRFSERREREDHAPRLREELPDLEVLDLVLSERRAESENADTTHTRRIVISAAPAYFQSNCGDTNCLDGGHEYTRQVMQPLRETATPLRGRAHLLRQRGQPHLRPHPPHPGNGEVPRPMKTADRAATLERLAGEVAASWVTSYLASLSEEGRPIEGGWPGTMPEARMRMDDHARHLLHARSMGPLTTDELGQFTPHRVRRGAPQLAAPSFAGAEPQVASVRRDVVRCGSVRGASARRPKNEKTAQARATAKTLAGVAPRVRDLMRRDPGVDGDAQRLGQLGWLLFLKVLDALHPDALPAQLRWASWALSASRTRRGDELLVFLERELFPALRSLPGDGLPAVVRAVFAEVTCAMRSGKVMAEVIAELDRVTLEPGDHQLGDMYERVLADLQNAGTAGEFYTPRALTRFVVDRIDPRAGETVLDPACGTGGFLTAALLHQPAVRLHGVEKKPLPHLLAVINLLLHGRVLAAGNLVRGNALDDRRAGADRFPPRVDVLLSNPPFGGVEEEGAQDHVTAELRSRDTADGFVLLALELLAPGGRCALVLPDGFLFGGGSKARLKKKLLEECNLHTIVRLPKGVFHPYTAIKTNLLFFTKGEPTGEVWFFEHEARRGPGARGYSRTHPLTALELAPIAAWWDARVETARAWKVTREELQARELDLDVKNPCRGAATGAAADELEDLAALLAEHREAREATADLHRLLQAELRAAIAPRRS